MAVLKEGTKVKTWDGLIGNVEARYDLGSVVYYIVKMENGALHKYFEDQLSVIEDEPAEESQEDAITITRKEFQEKAVATAGKLIVRASSNPIYDALLNVISAKLLGDLETVLFGKQEKNV